MRVLAMALVLALTATTAARGDDAPPAGQVPEPIADPSVSPANAQLSVDEAWLLERGYVTPGERAGGALLDWFVGFGAGQAVQGRWSHEHGWMFTAGEALSVGVLFYGIYDARADYLLFKIGLYSFAAVRLASIADALIGPTFHNRRLHELRGRLGMVSLAPYVAPDRGGAQAGLVIGF